MFELNRTLVNEVKYLVNEEEPPLLRQSMVFSEKEKSQLKAIGEYLISNKTVLDILLRRV